MHPKIKTTKLQNGISFEIQATLTPEQERKVSGAIHRALYLSDLPVSDDALKMTSMERIQVDAQAANMDFALATGDLATAASVAKWLGENLKTLSEVLPQRAAPPPREPRQTTIPFTVHTEESYREIVRIPGEE